MKNNIGTIFGKARSSLPAAIDVGGEVELLLDQYGRLSLSNVDSATGAVNTIDYEHHEIHSGSSFTQHYTNTTTNDDNHRTGIGFTTADSAKWMHITIEVTATHPAEVFLLEAPTIDADPGTNIAVLNRNRNIINTSSAGSLEAVPATDEVTTLNEAQFAAATFSGGAELEYMLLAGGGGPKAVGGAGRGEQEWVLAPKTKYVIYIKNVGANINTHLIHIDWYAHTNK